MKKNKKNFKKHDFEEKKIFFKNTILKKKILKKHDFEKSLHTKKSRFDSIYPVKCANFAFYVHF